MLVDPVPTKWQPEPRPVPIAAQVAVLVASPSEQAVGDTQVLVGPEPMKWQPVPSVAPIAVQVLRLVELPSPQRAVARVSVSIGTGVSSIFGHRDNFRHMFLAQHNPRGTRTCHTGAGWA